MIVVHNEIILLNLHYLIYSKRSTKSMFIRCLRTKRRVPCISRPCCVFMRIWNVRNATKLQAWMCNSPRVSIKSCLHFSTMSRSMHWFMWIQCSVKNFVLLFACKFTYIYKIAWKNIQQTFECVQFSSIFTHGFRIIFLYQVYNTKSSTNMLLYWRIWRRPIC